MSVGSNWVWDFGNNTARAFVPLAVLLVRTPARSDWRKCLKSAVSRESQLGEVLLWRTLPRRSDPLSDRIGPTGKLVPSSTTHLSA